MIPTEKRIARFKSIIAKKQFDVGIVLENVHNPHNIGAVLRSCDAVGILDIYLIYSTDRTDQTVFARGGKSARGSDKWLNVHFFTSAKSCMEVVNKKYEQVYATHLSEDSKSLYDLKLDSSVALVFGNELDGVSKEMMPYVTGNYIIPMEGMVQSLNISVACAISLYEIRRQRDEKQLYEAPFDGSNEAHTNLLKTYTKRHASRYKNEEIE